MKIIKRGIAPSRNYHLHCEQCGTIAEAHESEGVSRQNWVESWMLFWCPVCHSQIMAGVKKLRRTEHYLQTY